MIIFLGGEMGLGRGEPIQIEGIHPVWAFAFHGPFEGHERRWATLMTMVQRAGGGWLLQQHEHDGQTYTLRSDIQIDGLQYIPNDPSAAPVVIEMVELGDGEYGVAFSGGGRAWSVPVRPESPIEDLQSIELSSRALITQAIFSLPSADAVDDIFMVEPDGWRRFEDQERMRFSETSSDHRGDWKLLAWAQIDLNDDGIPEFFGAHRAHIDAPAYLLWGIEHPAPGDLSQITLRPFPFFDDPNYSDTSMLVEDMVSGHFRDPESNDLVLWTRSSMLVALTGLSMTEQESLASRGHTETFSIQEIRWLAAGHFGSTPLNRGTDQLLYQDSDGTIQCLIMDDRSVWRSCGWW